MRCATQSVSAFLIVLATLAQPAHAPIPIPPATAHTPHPLSCKPRPPFVLEARATAGSSDRWSLALRSLDVDRDVQVWMQNRIGERQVVWRGHLRQGEEKRLEVSYVASPGAESVLVGLEPVDMGRAIVRALVAAPVAGSAPRPAPGQKGLLLEDPSTGVKVRQYVGVGGSR